MKILLVSHSPLLTTGYARVASELAKALAAGGHAVVVAGLGFAGEVYQRPYRVVPWPGQPADVAAAITAERPDLLLTIGDPWMFAWLPDLPERRGVRWLAYFPVDGSPMPAAWRAWVAAVDVPVVFCQYTRRVVRECTGVDPRVVLHGVDTDTFRPLDKTWAKSRVGVDGKFVVGCVAANQQRKNLPALVRAFAAFARDKGDACLYLHTQIAGECWDVEELVRHHGVEPKTRATLNLDRLRGVPDDVLTTVYNAFDVFALPTMAEGFGLPIIESQACGVPALVTDFSACPELVPDPFCRLRVKATLVMARNFEQAVVDEDDLATKLDYLYRDRAELARLSAAGLTLARTLEWRQIGQQFVGLVSRL